MKILVYKNSGFCTGVQRAIDMALTATKKYSNVYCLGELVHNNTVVTDLAKKGILTVNNTADIPDNSTVIIRAHGVVPQVFDELKSRGCTVLDATCPYVRRIQQRARQYHDKGYTIVLVGNKQHPEIIGINGWCDNSAIVTDGKQQIDVRNHDKVLIMFQTTFDKQYYNQSLQNIFTDGVKTLEIFDTICYTTKDRQGYAHFAAKQSDMVIIIGDRHSSNTTKLYDIARRYCNDILWIPDGDVPDIDLSKYNTISILAGASTPKELIKGVLKRMSENAKETVVVTDGVADNAELTPEQMMEQAANNVVKCHVGQLVKATVVHKTQDGIDASLMSAKYGAFIPNEELTMNADYQAVKDSLQDGDTIECVILSIDNSGIKLSHKVIEERQKADELVENIKNGEQFQCVMHAHKTRKDILTGKLGTYTVIVHASQIKLGFVKDLKPYDGKPMTLVATPDKINTDKHTIFASHKAILLQEKQQKEDAFWNNIEENEIVEGKVLRFAPFGAFVSVRDFDCLAHTTDLSWERINHPQEVLEIGKTYEFVVLSLDREKNRVSLGYKQLQPKPWDLAAEKFVPGTTVKGKVARIMDFGAFIELDKHIDGLLHISNVAWDWVDDIHKALKIGDEIEVQIVDFDAENKRITLSRKALLEKPQQETPAPATENEQQSAE